MIRRLYVHNYRCLGNFEAPIVGHSSVLFIGKNGTGKTTLGLALEILQRIARGTNRVGELVKPRDLRERGVPMRFEIEVELNHKVFKYAIAFEYPDGFRELRVLEEMLTVGGKPIYIREMAQVRLTREAQEKEASFRIDWHLVALPIVQHRATNDPLFIFKQWLASILVLRPVPSSIRGDSDHETLQPNTQATDIGAWFAGLFAQAPASYSKIEAYLKQVMPDFLDIQNPQVGGESRSMFLRFSNQQGTLTLPFEYLSDGEKCFVIFAMVIAANDTVGPLCCYWDDPDNHLAPSEVGMAVMALRRAFKTHGQFIATSHDPEAIRSFSDENTFVLYRNSHLEPTLVRSVDQIRSSGTFKGDLIDALVRGDVDDS
ncbi:MAG TPA: AAA family ATPase [Stellaceae bacterium]|nr:AAA family ATPase [Stellaceae bacterium]